MKPHLTLFSYLIWISIIPSAYTQHDSLSSSARIDQVLTEVLNSSDAYQYEAQMKFKSGGSDSFEIRNFSVRYKTDSTNLLHGYNWEIGEVVDSGYLYTWMALPDSFYVFFEGNKEIGSMARPQTLDLGSYPEYIRSSFILHEVILPFINVDPQNIMAKDSGAYLYLTRQIDEEASGELVISKDTYLPIQSISRIGDRTFDFVQITEVNFTYNDNPSTKPLLSISSEHFISQDYKRIPRNNTPPAEKIDKMSFSKESIEFLLDYPFVSDTDDTFSLRSYNSGYILLDFWYTSCAPCLQAMPAINKLAQDYVHENLVVIGINCFDMAGKINVAKKLRLKNITFPLLFGSKDLVQNLDINSFPSYILITPDRDIEYIGHTGHVKQALEDLFKK